MKAYSPEGNMIVGIAQIVPGTTGLGPNSFDRKESGDLSFRRDSFVDLHWDNQEDERFNGERVFVDSQGFTWLESEITLASERDFSPDEKLRGPETALEREHVRNVERLWEALGQVPISDEDELEQTFLSFLEGTPKEEVWTYFEEELGVSVAYLMGQDPTPLTPAFDVGMMHQRALNHLSSLHQSEEYNVPAGA